MIPTAKLGMNARKSRAKQYLQMKVDFCYNLSIDNFYVHICCPLCFVKMKRVKDTFMITVDFKTLYPIHGTIKSWRFRSRGGLSIFAVFSLLRSLYMFIGQFWKAISNFWVLEAYEIISRVQEHLIIRNLLIISKKQHHP